MSRTWPPLAEMTPEDFQAHFDERSLNTHDPDAVASHFAESAVQRWVSSSDEVRGRDAIRQAVAGLFEGFPDFNVHVRDTFASGSRICVELTFRGTHDGPWRGVPPTHRRIEVDVCVVFRMGADGLVEHETIYSDSATFMRQLGLGP